ncbi:MAG TPA: amidase [Caulobacteraceae bacterium]|nr:amidase [Caulobacteraceae bacterium]
MHEDGGFGFDRRTILSLAGGAIAAVTTQPGRAHAATPASDIVMMDAASLAAAIAARRVSCAEVMSAFLAHIATLNSKVNAIVALQAPDDLMAQARAHDAVLARGEAIGPLHGLPHAVKDLAWVKGIRSTSGSLIFKDFVPTHDALFVERLRAAGAIFIGKTNAPEFGLGSHTYNRVYGATRNAYGPSVSAGGSSGGAAVALALRMVPLADGSDFGGSLRNPAGWNNVFGFRPSWGVVPAAGPEVWLPGMGVAGPMARNVPDLAMLLAVQAGYDPRAPLSLDEPGGRFRAPLEADFREARIGWLGDFAGWAPYEPGVLELCRTALKSFEALGCVVEEAIPAMAPEPVWQAFITLRAWMEGVNLAEFYRDPAHRALLKPEAIWEAELGLRTTGEEITAASVVRTQWSSAMRRLFARYDYLVAPTAQVFPFAIEQTWPHEIAGHPMATYHEWMKAVCLITMSGCPALAVPAGFGAAGLPMGLQIIAPVHQEMACLKLAHAYDAATGWTTRRPPPLLSGRG